MLAAQNAMLAAESLRLGACYIGAIRSNARDIIRLLRLPRLMFPIAGMTIGWPLGQASVFDLDAPDLFSVWRRNKVAPVPEVPKEAMVNSPCTASRPRT